MGGVLINGVLTVLFIIFAVLQFNDPDPALWVTLYLIIAVFTGMAIFKVYPKILILAATLGLFIYSLFYLPSIFEWLAGGTTSDIMNRMDDEKMFIEESREFFGLVIGLCAMLFVLIQSRRVRA